MDEMKVKGRETLKALAEGRTVLCLRDRHMYRMDEDGRMLTRLPKIGWARTVTIGAELWSEEMTVLADEEGAQYTPRRALELMLAGYTVANDEDPDTRWGFKDDELWGERNGERVTTMAIDKDSKWRVVE